MRFSLDVMRARKGDCLMLHYGTKDDPQLIMIDGGPSKVYKPHLQPRIEKIRNVRNLDVQKPLPVEVLMISHVDDDHIKGILDLTKELRGLRQTQSPLPIRVASLWHNTFDDLLKTTPEELSAEASFGTAALAGTIKVPDDATFDAAMVLASIPQGRDLRDAAKFLQWKPNHKFDGKLILATDESKPVTLNGGLKLTVVGPMKPELEALQKEHDKWLRKKKESPEAALAAFSDDSIPNLSSIVVLAEAGGKKMLLTGDARGDKIMEGLQMVGLLGAGTTSKMHVDLLKVPHHGSDNNLDVDFFERITADHYVFSGNGEHGNPEREALRMLFDARGDKPFTMHFTYPIDDIDAGRKKEHEKKAAWSRPKHSLAAFFGGKDLAAKGQKISTINGDTEPHVIDLLDPVGF